MTHDDLFAAIRAIAPASSDVTIRHSLADSGGTPREDWTAIVIDRATRKQLACVVMCSTPENALCLVEDALRDDGRDVWSAITAAAEAAHAEAS